MLFGMHSENREVVYDKMHELCIQGIVDIKLIDKLEYIDNPSYKVNDWYTWNGSYLSAPTPYFAKHHWYLYWQDKTILPSVKYCSLDDISSLNIKN